jgi:hypothetical protein
LEAGLADSDPEMAEKHAKKGKNQPGLSLHRKREEEAGVI